MPYETEVRIASPRSLAVVRERMAPFEIPKRVMPMLDRAYAALKDAKMTHDGQNVFVYRGTPATDSWTSRPALASRDRSRHMETLYTS